MSAIGVNKGENPMAKLRFGHLNHFTIWKTKMLGPGNIFWQPNSYNRESTGEIPTHPAAQTMDATY